MLGEIVITVLLGLGALIWARCWRSRVAPDAQGSSRIAVIASLINTIVGGSLFLPSVTAALMSFGIAGSTENPFAWLFGVVTASIPLVWLLSMVSSWFVVLRGHYVRGSRLAICGLIITVGPLIGGYLINQFVR